MPPIHSVGKRCTLFRKLLPLTRYLMPAEVNLGPQEICNTFLAPSAASPRATAEPLPPEYTQREVDRLRSSVGELLSVLGAALEASNAIIEADQMPLHEELVKGYAQLKALVVPLLAQK